MKEEILKLRNEGKSYNEIQKELQCSKGTISYYCGEGQKEKTKNRTQKRRKNKLIANFDRFKYTKSRCLGEQVRRFNKKDNQSKRNINKTIIPTFTIEDVINKFGVDTVCYLTGEKINLYNDDYSFDHILPSSRNGENTLNNLGITLPTVNRMKSDLTPEELFQWCIKILNHNGYSITK